MRRPSALAIVVVLFVLLVAAWVVGNTEWGEVELPTPLRGDAATNPFYAAQRLVETLGATSERRESLGDARSDAVIVLSTWGWDIDQARRAELERWVEVGRPARRRRGADQRHRRVRAVERDRARARGGRSRRRSAFRRRSSSKPCQPLGEVR